MTSPLVVPVCGYMTLSRFDSFSVCPSTSTFCSRGDMGPGCRSCGARSRIGRSKAGPGARKVRGRGRRGISVPERAASALSSAPARLSTFSPQPPHRFSRGAIPPAPSGRPRSRTTYRSALALVLGRRSVVSWGMRAIWSGEITFGLVNVPVKLYGATRSHDISFHQVHDEDHGRIRYQRHCEVCGRQIDFEHIEKAYNDGDKTVILSDEELDSLPAEDNDQIDVVQFVPDEQVDPILFGTSYFLEPVGRSPKSYVLLRRTLEETERTAIVTFTLRTKTRLGVLRVHDDLMVLQTMRWPKDLREVDFAPSGKRSEPKAKEVEMAGALVEQFSDDFDPEQFTDEYQEQLRTLLDEKLERGETVDTEATFGEEREEQEEREAEGGKVLSLMDALERSVTKRRGSATDSDKEGSGSEKSSGSQQSSGSTKSSDSKKSGSSGGSAKSSSSESGSAKSSSTSGSKSGSSKGGSKSGGTKKSGGSKKSDTSKKSSSSKQGKKSA